MKSVRNLVIMVLIFMSIPSFGVIEDEKTVSQSPITIKVYPYSLLVGADFGVSDYVKLGVYGGFSTKNISGRESLTEYYGFTVSYLPQMTFNEGVYFKSDIQACVSDGVFQTDGFDYVSADLASFSFSGLVGYQWIFQSKFSIELGLGFYRAYVVSMEGGAVNPAFKRTGEFTVGYMF